MKLTIVVVKFLFIGALYIISNQNIHVLDPGQMSFFLDSYSLWLASLFTSAQGMTGYLSKVEWFPGHVGFGGV